MVVGLGIVPDEHPASEVQQTVTIAVHVSKPNVPDGIRKIAVIIDIPPLANVSIIGNNPHEHCNYQEVNSYPYHRKPKADYSPMSFSAIVVFSQSSIRWSSSPKT